MFCAEAAVELLIGHRRWLLRGDFVGEFIETFESMETDRSMAFVDWPAAITAVESGAMPSSSSEVQVLRIAASLAEGIAVDLRDTLCGLDAANALLVSQAVLHAVGHEQLDGSVNR